jgi:hypothetical protein
MSSTFGSSTFGEHRYVGLVAACHTLGTSVAGLGLEDEPGDVVVEIPDSPHQRERIQIVETIVETGEGSAVATRAHAVARACWSGNSTAEAIGCKLD